MIEMLRNNLGRKIRILNVLLDNRIGGPQIRVLSIAEGLIKYGITTVMVAPNGEGDFTRRGIEKGFKTYQVMLYRPQHFNSFGSIFANLRWLFSFPISVLAIARIIKKERIDIVHIHGLLNLQASLAALLTGTKIVWHLSSTLFPTFIVLSLMPFVELVSTRTIIIGERLREYYFRNKKNLPKNLIIYGPVDINKFSPDNVSEAEKARLRVEFNIEPHSKIVGCVGHINPTKGYEYFIQSADLVKKESEGVKFIIVGAMIDTQKKYYQKLQSLILSLGMENDIVFAGNRDDIPQMLSIFDVFVLPSISEGGPRVTVEAMAMEKLVVATDVGAVPEQIIDCETGIIVPLKNPKILATAILYLLNNSTKRVTMGKRARERVTKMFSLEKCVEEYRKLYEDVINSG